MSTVGARGEEAQRILESPVLRRAMEDALRRIQDEWVQCESAERREALWHKARGLNDGVLRELRIYRDDATIEREQAK